MGFLHPWVLLALPAVGIPILLHLRHQRSPLRVPFPAVRYLLDATRAHERQLRLRHWLLLVLRTLAILALVLAAAGSSLPLRGVSAHPPTPLVLVVDNSLSSGAVAGGVRRLDQIQRAADRVLAAATPSDALWLISADGIPRRGTREELRAVVDSLVPSGARLDLGGAVASGAEVVAADGRPGGVVVITDLQATSVSAAEVHVPVVVIPLDAPAVADRGVAEVGVGAQPWGTDGARVVITVSGDPGPAAPVSVTLGDRPARQALVAPGAPATLTLPGVRPGWYVISARLDPDELRADDSRSIGVRVAPLAAVRWEAADRFVGAALETLEADQRVRRGDEVTVGRLGNGISVLFPPSDLAAVGALDRALGARGISWRFGVAVDAPAEVDSGAWLPAVAVHRRLRLTTSESGRTGVLATVDGEPWIVRSGNVVLVGSRLEPEWTDLPYRAAFVPFVDALVNRMARGEVAALTGSVGAATLLPEATTEVRREGLRWRVEGGAAFVPPTDGVYWLLTGRDTVGALSVAGDPRESDLRPAAAGVVARLWGAREVGAEQAGAAAFALAARADLRGPLLWLAFGVVGAELLLAAWGGRTRPE